MPTPWHENTQTNKPTNQTMWCEEPLHRSCRSQVENSFPDFFLVFEFHSFCPLGQGKCTPNANTFCNARNATKPNRRLKTMYLPTSTTCMYINVCTHTWNHEHTSVLSSPRMMCRIITFWDSCVAMSPRLFRLFSSPSGWPGIHTTLVMSKPRKTWLKKNLDTRLNTSVDMWMHVWFHPWLYLVGTVHESPTGWLTEWLND